MKKHEINRKLRFWNIFLVISTMYSIITFLTFDYAQEVWKIILNVSGPILLMAIALMSIYDLKKHQND